MSILSILYYVIGVVLTAYWYFKEYKHEINEESENWSVSMVLLFCVFFWPIKICCNLIKKIKNYKI